MTTNKTKSLRDITAKELEAVMENFELDDYKVSWSHWNYEIAEGYTLEDNPDYDSSLPQTGTGGINAIYIKVTNPGVHLPGIGYVLKYDSHGGMGQGDEYWTVWKVTAEDGSLVRFFRKDGYYASFSGGTLDGEFEEVYPRDKVIQVWKAV